MFFYWIIVNYNHKQTGKRSIMKVYVIKYDYTNIDLRLDSFDVEMIEKGFNQNEYYVTGNGKEGVFLDLLDCFFRGW